jgi:DNA repair protein RadA/Sms
VTPKRRAPKLVCTRCTTPYTRWPGATCRQCGAFSTAIVTLDEARARGLPLPVSLLGDETRASRQRWSTGLAALDRILSHEGGIVPGASVLLASCPGGGKTTLLMAACGAVAQRRRALYISSEQDVAALRALAGKVGVADRDRLLPVARQNVEDVAQLIAATAPALAVVDSANELARWSGRQVGEVVGILHGVAHDTGAAICITSHVNREGLVRGGPALEHATDAVVMMTGDPRRSPRRELAASKNRHGDTTLTTAIEMTAHGFVDIDGSPAIPRRPLPIGAAHGLVFVDGKPQLVTVEAMTSPRSGSGERRVQATGCAAARVTTIIAILERQGVSIDGDVVVRVADGMNVTAPALDAGIAGALVSLSRAAPLPSGVVLHGELALDGTIRTGDVDIEARALGRLVGRPGEKLVDALGRAHLVRVS